MKPNKRDFNKLCKLFGITPEQVLSQFISDLISGSDNGGSDERRMAKEYFIRAFCSTEAGEAAIQDLEDLYDANYPSVSNSNFSEKRKQQIETWYKEWAPIMESAEETEDFLNTIKEVIHKQKNDE